MAHRMILSTLLLLACSTPYVAPPEPSWLGLAAENGRSPGEDAADGVDSATMDSGDIADSAGDTDEEEMPAEAFTPPCVTYGSTLQTGTVGDASLNEISGVAASWRNPGALWVMEDHAAPNEVYAIDAEGNVVARVVLEGVVNNDWEDLAVGVCGDTTCLFVGDIGDNEWDRPWHGVLRFEEPDLSGEGAEDLTITPDIFPYVFPNDGHWDSEALAIQPNGLPVLFTKEYDTEASTAYSFPVLDAAQTVTLDERGRFETGTTGEGGGAATTAADLWPDGTRLILRTYAHIWEFTLTDGGLDDLEDAARVELFTGAERQGEAIGYDPFSRAYYTLSEDVNPPVFRTDCSE